MEQGSSLLVGQREAPPKFSGNDITGQFGRAQYAKGKMLLMSRGRHTLTCQLDRPQTYQALSGACGCDFLVTSSSSRAA